MKTDVYLDTMSKQNERFPEVVILVGEHGATQSIGMLENADTVMHYFGKYSTKTTRNDDRDEDVDATIFL